MIVSLHVATGAAAGAATGSRLAAVMLGPILHLAGDRLPHQDIGSRRFEIGSGLAALVLFARAVARSIRRPRRRGRLPHPTSSTSSRSCAQAAASSSTAAEAGTARAASPQICSYSWPARFSARSSPLNDHRLFGMPKLLRGSLGSIILERLEKGGIHLDKRNRGFLSG